MKPFENHFRWKYAEQNGKRLVDAGHAVLLVTAPDAEYTEDGFAYSHPQFLLYDLGSPINTIRVVGIITESEDGDQEVIEFE